MAADNESDWQSENALYELLGGLSNDGELQATLQRHIKTTFAWLRPRSRAVRVGADDVTFGKSANGGDAVTLCYAIRGLPQTRRAPNQPWEFRALGRSEIPEVVTLVLTRGWRGSVLDTSAIMPGRRAPKGWFFQTRYDTLGVQAQLGVRAIGRPVPRANLTQVSR